MKRPGTVKLALAWLALAVLAGAALWPRWKAISRLEARSVELAQMIEQADDVNTQMRLLTEWMMDIEQRVRASTTPIPRDSGVSELVRDLTDRFDELGVVEREITTGAPSPGEDASTLPMTIAARGSFTSVMKSIGWIESLPRLVRIRRIKITRARDWTPEAPRVAAEILLDAFFNPTPIPERVDLTSLIAKQEEGP